MENRTVLFVDDEEKVLRSLKRGFLDEPYKTLFAESGKQALEILEQNEVHVIVTDMRMPEMSGLELLEIVKEKHPQIIRMVLSGYTQITTLLTAINHGEIFRFITKPWKLEEEFKTVVRQAIDYYNLQRERDRLLGELSQYNLELEEKVHTRTEQLLAITKQAEIGKYASEIVHNLNSPLQNILKFLELIDKSLPKKEPSLEKLVRYTGQALSSVNDLKTMIAGILKHAKAQEIEDDEPVNINEIIKHELDFLEINPFFKTKTVKNINLAENLPKIIGKPIHFKQIIDNLLTNAIDAMQYSTVCQLTVRSYLRKQDIVIDVTDTGEGIDPENLEKIFSPDFTTKPIGKGTGLGLASVKEMVESYGGKIEVKSIKGQGSKFSITIPLVRNHFGAISESLFEKEETNASKT